MSQIAYTRRDEQKRRQNDFVGMGIGGWGAVFADVGFYRWIGIPVHNCRLRVVGGIGPVPGYPRSSGTGPSIRKPAYTVRDGIVHAR